jgi:hypothetical protein
MQSTMENLRGKLVSLGAAAQAIGLEHHWKELAAHRQRVQDSHVAMGKAAGFEVEKNGDDDMGDLTITGDIQIPQPQANNGMAKMAIAATVGAAVASGGLASVNHIINKQPAADAPVVAEDVDTRNTIRFAD